MSTGLDVAASVAGLITLADIVIDRTYRTIKACKNAGKDSRRLLTETQALLGVLTGLLKLAQQVNQTALASHIAAETVHDCQQTLTTVRDKLAKADPDEPGISKISKVTRTLKWPFTITETDEIMREVERYKIAFDLSVSMDVLEVVLQSSNDHQSKLDEVAKSVKDLVRIATNEERLSVLRFFHTFEPQSNHENNVQLRHAGTGLWLTRGVDFNDWKATPNSKLWVYGIPGAGKTVLTAALIEEMVQVASEEYALAYFTCDYKSENTRRLQIIISSIAGQLARQNERCFRRLSLCHRPREDQAPRHTLPSVDELTRLIRTMIAEFDDVAIVVDGVDECLEPAEVAFTLAELSKSCPKLRMILTSRREQIIELQLSYFKYVSIAAQSDDLKLYVSSQLDERTRKGSLRLKNTALKDEILEKLVHGADGMFRWVACQIDHLCRLPSDAARRKALTCLPPDLYATYDRILERIDRNGLESSGLAQRTLRWLFHKDWWMEGDELCEALSVDSSTEKVDIDAIPSFETILDLCGSLIRERDKGLEFAHFTVKEYLSSDRVKNDPSLSRYFCSEQIVEEFKAGVCLRYLSLPDFNLSDLKKWQDLAIVHLNSPFYVYASSCPQLFCHKLDTDSESFTLLCRLFTDLPGQMETWKLSYLFTQYLDYRDWELVSTTQPTNDTQEGCSDPGLRDVDSAVSTSDPRIVGCGRQVDLNATYLSALWFRLRAIASDSNPLHYASMLHLPPLVIFLASRGADISQAGALGTTMECAIRGDPLLHLLDRFQQDISRAEYSNESYWTPMENVPSHRQETVNAIAGLGFKIPEFWTDMQLQDMMFAASYIYGAAGFLRTLDELPTIILDSLLEKATAYKEMSQTTGLFDVLKTKRVRVGDEDKLSQVLLALAPRIEDLRHTVPSSLSEPILERVCKEDDVSTLKWLLQSNGIDSCQWSSASRTSLFEIAAKHCAADIFGYLLEQHDSSGCKSLHQTEAAEVSTPVITKHQPNQAIGMLEESSEGSKAFQDYFSVWACSESDSKTAIEAMLIVLLRLGLDPVRLDSTGHTIMHELIERGNDNGLITLKQQLPSADFQKLTGTASRNYLPIELAVLRGRTVEFHTLYETSSALRQAHPLFRLGICAASVPFWRPQIEYLDMMQKLPRPALILRARTTLVRHQFTSWWRS